ncbi:hypothetical protein B0J14DRAFT_468056 [Halenospora varia]|nr:hypothetical protein B0J14DRAFT_468056 [Halenospora varia]
MVKRNVRGGKPSDYPRIPFHLLRTAQLLSSATVSAIMGYFMYFLKKEHYNLPWTFILLLAVSCFTILALTITIILYNFTFLSPRFNTVLNGGLSVLWAVGMGMLTWSIASSNVLAKQCSAKVWSGEAQAGVCRDYKALWSMTLVGAVSTFAALALDIHTWTKTTKRGAYVLPEDDKVALKMKAPPRGGRQEGFEPTRDVHGQGSMMFEQEREIDIGYHNRYGADEAQVADGAAQGLMAAKPHP